LRYQLNIVIFHSFLYVYHRPSLPFVAPNWSRGVFVGRTTGGEWQDGKAHGELVGFRRFRDVWLRDLKNPVFNIIQKRWDIYRSIMIYHDIYIYTMMYQYLNKIIIYDLFGFYITYLGFKHGFWSNWNGECDKSTTTCRLGCSPTSTVGYWVSCCRFGNVTIPSFTVKGVWTTEMYRHVKKCIEMWYMGMRIDQIWWYHIVACFPSCLQNHPFAHHVPICPNKKGRQFFPSRGHGTYTSKQFMAQKFRRKMFSQNWENWEFSPKHTTISTIMADHLFNIAKIH